MLQLRNDQLAEALKLLVTQYIKEVGGEQLDKMLLDDFVEFCGEITGSLEKEIN